jgi:hypothetical protein
MYLRYDNDNDPIEILKLVKSKGQCNPSEIDFLLW